MCQTSSIQQLFNVTWLVESYVHDWRHAVGSMSCFYAETVMFPISYYNYYYCKLILLLLLLLLRRFINLSSCRLHLLLAAVAESICQFSCSKRLNFWEKINFNTNKLSILWILYAKVNYLKPVKLENICILFLIVLKVLKIWTLSRMRDWNVILHVWSGKSSNIAVKGMTSHLHNFLWFLYHHRGSEI